jgi:RNA polymerase sigma factor FliA
VVGWFFQDRPMSELAVELGVTESRISQLRSEAMSLLSLALIHHLADAGPPQRSVTGPAVARPAGVADRRRQAYIAAVGNANTWHRRSAAHRRPAWASPAMWMA